jgi:predicted nuclease of predicted toxin-antitoxin system
VRFIIDAQLPPALTRFLISFGHEAEHVSDIGLASASDGRIWRHAVERGAVIITKDEDFMTLRALRPDGPPIVWVRIGNTTRESLLLVMTSAMPEIVAALEGGETVVEVTG